MKTRLVNQNFKTDWVDNLLISRGIREEDIEYIKRPTIESLNDPNSLTNIHEAAAMIVEAIHQNKRLGLLVDCDVDGITSATIIYHYIK